MLRLRDRRSWLKGRRREEEEEEWIDNCRRREEPNRGRCDRREGELVDESGEKRI